MKDFVRPAGRLRGLPFAARLVYSTFCVFSVIALAETAWLGADMLGADLAEVDSYYAGGSVEPPASSADASENGASLGPGGGGGPVIELPEEGFGAALERDPMPLRKLLEVTHFHLFTMPVYLLILAHLFMLSRIHAAVKTGFITAGSLGVLLHLLAPWIARSGARFATLFYAVSGTLLLASMLVMSVVPMVEMWASPPSKPGRSRSDSRSSPSQD